MKRLAASYALLALVAAGVSPPSFAGGITTVGVRNGDSERSFYLSRTKVDPGPAIIQYTNTGEDPHDLKLKRRRAPRIFAIGQLKPGQLGELTPILKADSKYVLWCSLDGHRESGMEAVLFVRKN